MNDTPHRRLCLITGASAGIGAEFARQFAARGWDVALTARRGDRLKALAEELETEHHITAIVLEQDLALKGSIVSLMKKLKETGRDVDGLVNNAGYGLPGTFFNTSWKDQDAFIRVLYTAPIELTHALLPGMAERGFGRIINVASLAGYLPGSAGHTLYASVKAGIIKFSESIVAECQAAGHSDVFCTALCPGFTYSEFHDVNGTRDLTDKMSKALWMDAAPVVTAGINGVNAGKPVVVPGMVNKSIATLVRILPESLARALVRQQSGKFREIGSLDEVEIIEPAPAQPEAEKT